MKTTLTETVRAAEKSLLRGRMLERKLRTLRWLIAALSALNRDLGKDGADEIPADSLDDGEE